MSRDDTLILVHSVIRHGHRTPDKTASYPKDPYRNNDYYPYGDGMLTDTGKRATYSTGQAFRRRYGGFLGDLYFPEILETWSTAYHRCIATAQLVLAGLFPPTGVQKWHDNLNWQPIPVYYKPADQDKMLIPYVIHPEYFAIYERGFRTEFGESLLKKYEDLIPYIATHTGWEITTTQLAFYLRDLLRSQEDWGLEIPDWAKTIYPERISEMAYEDYKMQISTRQLRRRGVGLLMKKILDDSLEKIKGKSQRKIHLYICHEVNLAYLLILLGLMYKHFPDYACSLTLELHKRNDKYGFKLLYKKNFESDFEPLTLNDGRSILWIEDYEKIVQELFIEDENDTTLIYGD